MEFPAVVSPAGTIALDFAAKFPELLQDSIEKVYLQELCARRTKIDRLHVICA